MTTQQAMRLALTTLTPDELRARADQWQQERGIQQDADPLYRAMAVEHSAREEVARQQYRKAYLRSPLA